MTKVTLAGSGTTAEKIYFFSDDYSKDGSRKTGYQKVAFDDDTYQMYFNNNGTAANGYVSKIKKYCNKGIVLAANNDDSNYGLIHVTSDTKELANQHVVVEYDYSTLTDRVLVNAAGTVQKNKFNLKDSNDVYYVTDSKGFVLYASPKKLYTTNTEAHNVLVTVGTKSYYTE